MSSKLKTRVRKMNFQRQGNERNFDTGNSNFEETKYYDNLYTNRTKKFLRKGNENTQTILGT